MDKWTSWFITFPSVCWSIKSWEINAQWEKFQTAHWREMRIQQDCTGRQRPSRSYGIKSFWMRQQRKSCRDWSFSTSVSHGVLTLLDLVMMFYFSSRRASNPAGKTMQDVAESGRKVGDRSLVCLRRCWSAGISTFCHQRGSKTSIWKRETIHSAAAAWTESVNDVWGELADQFEIKKTPTRTKKKTTAALITTTKVWRITSLNKTGARPRRVKLLSAKN